MASIRLAPRLLSRRLTQITLTHSSTAVGTTRRIRPFIPVASVHTSRALRRDDSSPKSASSPLPAEDPNSKIYTFEDIQSLSSSASSTESSSSGKRVLVDVREPDELKATGQIPGALNIPVASAPDSFFLSEEDFEDRYGFSRPSSADEVIFYCKAGVRSKAAARLAAQARFGGKVGEFPGSWNEWVAKGGKIERA